MNILVIINSDRDVQLNYTVELKSWSKYEMKVFLNFSDPLIVSAGLKPDMLVIDVVNPYLFTSQSSGEWLQEDKKVIDSKITKQYERNYDPSTMDRAAELLDSVAKSMTFG